MTNESNPADELREARKLDAALEQCSEAQLTHFLHNIEALLADFDMIAIPNREVLEIVTDTQDRLQVWRKTVSRIRSLTQAKDAYDQLHNWDNEGGTVQQSTSRRLVSQMVDGHRRLVWADVEGVRER